MKLMIVESPNKVKKITAILGEGWTVMASSGHIRDLPPKDLGIDEGNYALQYEFVPGRPIPGEKNKTYPGGEERVRRIAAAAWSAETVYLATDPDREGEAIAWHLQQTIDLPPARYKRVTFDAITPAVINAALQCARAVDLNLVRAQEGRRALDRLVGWRVSPLLRDQLGMNASAGRVQSPAVRIVVDREREIRGFKETKHFGAVVTFDKGAWSAEWHTEPHLPAGEKYILSQGLAQRAAACRRFRVLFSETTTQREAPPPPFSTSLLLQAASVSLKLAPAKTANLAQKLFELGAITYHRTDSVNFSDEAIAEIRGFAGARGLPLPDGPRRFKTKGDAQEAHEAIRPTHLADEDLGEDEDQKRLYRLIWQRAVASQLADATYTVTTLRLESLDESGFEFRARGRVPVSPGWRSLVAGDAAADPLDESEEGAAGGQVPALAVGTAAQAEDGKILQKKTKPPARYTQATLIKRLEAAGIGRPSTYPAIMTNILDRGYLIEQRRQLSPTQIGESLVDALTRARFSFIELAFTRDLEAQLDDIAGAKRTYRDVVQACDHRLRDEISGAAAEPAAPAVPCPACGKAMRRVEGKNGWFWGCSAFREGCKTTLPDEKGQPVTEVQTHPCPSCSKPMRRIKGSKGYFWGCSGYRDGCKTTLEDKNGKPVPTAARKGTPS